MADFLTDLANFLITKGFKTAIDEDIFLDSVPNDKTEFMSLLEYDSSRYRRIQKTVDRKVQINMVSYNGFQAKKDLNNLFNFLSNTSNDVEGIYVLDTGRIFIFNPLGTPFKLKKDEKNRTYYVLNVLITTNKDN